MSRWCESLRGVPVFGMIGSLPDLHLIKEGIMFKHVAMWEFEDDDDPLLNRENAIKIKAGLEELVYEVHGLKAIDVHIDRAKTPTANADILMESVFDNRDAYHAFIEHPRRKDVARLIESCTGKFLCMDFEVPQDEQDMV